MPNNLQPSAAESHVLLPENTSGRDFIIADLHGYRAQLEQKLKSLQFDPESDRVISVGDLIDRGPDSVSCLELLQQPWFFAVRGNHEQMLIDSISLQTDAHWSRWLSNGGSWALEQNDSWLESWRDTLKRLPLTITLPCQGQLIGICHAEYTLEDWALRHKADANEQAEMIWGRSRLKHQDRSQVYSIDWLFNGHTIVPGVEVLGNSVFIDCGVYQNNPLTVIELKHWLDQHS